MVDYSKSGSFTLRMLFFMFVNSKMDHSLTDLERVFLFWSIMKRIFFLIPYNFGKDSGLLRIAEIQDIRSRLLQFYCVYITVYRYYKPFCLCVYIVTLTSAASFCLNVRGKLKYYSTHFKAFYIYRQNDT